MSEAVIRHEKITLRYIQSPPGIERSSIHIEGIQETAGDHSILQIDIQKFARIALGSLLIPQVQLLTRYPGWVSRDRERDTAYSASSMVITPSPLGSCLFQDVSARLNK